MFSVSTNIQTFTVGDKVKQIPQTEILQLHVTAVAAQIALVCLNRGLRNCEVDTTIVS